MLIRKNNNDMPVKIGQRFFLMCYGYSLNSEYILAQIDHKRSAKGDYSLVALISIQTGNRWHSPVKVKDVMNLTEKEIEKVFHSATVDYYFQD